MPGGDDDDESSSSDEEYDNALSNESRATPASKVRLISF